MKKKCEKCKKLKDVSGFSKDRSSKDGYCRKCKACSNKYRRNRYKSFSKKQKKAIYKKRKTYYKKWAAEHPELAKEAGRKHTLKKYGITIDAYEKIFNSQQQKCCICSKKWIKGSRKFDVDHNHKTNYIRGILCGYCNSLLLKHLRDNKIRAKGLISYLQAAIDGDTDWK